MESAKPLKVVLNTPEPDPLNAVLSAKVGFWVLLYTMPRDVIGCCSALLTFPPMVAVVSVMEDAGEVETVTILGKFNSVNSLAQEDRSSANAKNKYSNFLFIKLGILTEIGALARIQNVSISALFIMLSGNSP